VATPAANFPDILMDFSFVPINTVTVRTKFEFHSNVRRTLKQRQNTSIADIIDIADNVNLKYRYTVLSIKKTDIQMTHHYEARPKGPKHVETD